MTEKRFDGPLQLILVTKRNRSNVCSVPIHNVATPVYWIGLMEVNHPFMPYQTLLKRNVIKLDIRDYVRYYGGTLLVFFRVLLRLKEDWKCMNRRKIGTMWRSNCSCGKPMSVIQDVPGENAPDFGRMFLTLKYTDITQNTYIRS